MDSESYIKLVNTFLLHAAQEHKEHKAYYTSESIPRLTKKIVPFLIAH